MTKTEPDPGRLGLPPSPPGILARHGAAMARHARAVAIVVLLTAVGGYLVAALGIGGPSLFSRLEVGEPAAAGEALSGQRLLEAADPSGLSIQGLWDDIDPQSPQVLALLARANAQVLRDGAVLGVADPTTLGPAAVSSDGRAALISVTFDRKLTKPEQQAAEERAMAELEQLAEEVPGSSMSVTGQRLLVESITHQVEADLRKGEGISLPLSLIVMVLIFGGFAAAGVPLAGALASIAGGLVTLLLWSYVMELDATVVNVVSVLGLGLCIDYSLLMVSRYREEMHDLHDLTATEGPQQVPAAIRELAMARTMATAGRTVIFSGVTVAIAVLGLLLIDVTVIRSVGAGAVSVVLVAVAAATTFVPALLVLATRHVAGRGMLARLPGLRRHADRFDHVPVEDGAFSRWARRVQRHPWAAFLGVTVVLVVLSIPAWRINPVSSGAELLPPGSTHRDLYFEIQQRFPALAQPDITVIAEGNDPAVLEPLADQVAQLPGVARVGPVRPVGELVTFGVFVQGSGQGAQAKELVQTIRAQRAEEPQTWVTGQVAVLVDFVDQLRHDIPYALGFVIVATLVLLFLLTGSVLIPVKALLMNMLSLGATFGILVLLFQDGRFEGLLGYQSTGGIEAILPVIIFAFAFGLSMDYEVFLLARIKEFHDGGLDNDESVRQGLQRTGRIITSAAALIIIVFAGFILGDLLAIKENGVALAIAVFIDATLVRIILVPATMTLLGEWNWWAPRPLRRLHDRIGISH